MSDLLEEYSVITSGSRRSLGLYIIYSKKKKKREKENVIFLWYGIFPKKILNPF